MQITASAAISTISARMSCVMRSGICVGLSPTGNGSFPPQQSSNPRQRHARLNRKLGRRSSGPPFSTTTMTENNQSEMPGALLTKKGSRRDFLRNTAVTALATGALTACTDKSEAQQTRRSDEDHSGGTMAPNPAPVSAAAAAEAMDRMHEAGIKAFPAKTAG